ncbi:MAG: hypothetical protein K9K68_07200 [Methylococcaceae bacterium]|nr:hypothetical protein [Methylococcaceae bacterium]
MKYIGFTLCAMLSTINAHAGCPKKLNSEYSGHSYTLRAAGGNPELAYASFSTLTARITNTSLEIHSHDVANTVKDTTITPGGFTGLTLPFDYNQKTCSGSTAGTGFTGHFVVGNGGKVLHGVFKEANNPLCQDSCRVY